MRTMVLSAGLLVFAGIALLSGHEGYTLPAIGGALCVFFMGDD